MKYMHDMHTGKAAIRPVVEQVRQFFNGRTAWVLRRICIIDCKSFFLHHHERHALWVMYIVWNEISNISTRGDCVRSRCVRRHCLTLSIECQSYTNNSAISRYLGTSSGRILLVVSYRSIREDQHRRMDWERRSIPIQCLFGHKKELTISVEWRHPGKNLDSVVILMTILNKYSVSGFDRLLSHYTPQGVL